MEMSTLNKHLMEHVSKKVYEDMSCNLVPVLEDYRCHVADISAKYSNQTDTTQTSAKPTSAEPPSIKGYYYYYYTYIHIYIALYAELQKRYN